MTRHDTPHHARCLTCGPRLAGRQAGGLAGWQAGGGRVGSLAAGGRWQVAGGSRWQQVAGLEVGRPICRAHNIYRAPECLLLLLFLLLLTNPLLLLLLSRTYIYRRRWCSQVCIYIGGGSGLVHMFIGGGGALVYMHLVCLYTRVTTRKRSLNDARKTKWRWSTGQITDIFTHECSIQAHGGEENKQTAIAAFADSDSEIFRWLILRI